MKDYIGQKFNKLKVLKKEETTENASKHSKYKYICQCDCGNTISANIYSLLNNNTKSCGCLKKNRPTYIKDKIRIKNTKYHPIISSAKNVYSKMYNDNLSFKDFYKLSQLNCYYCDQPPSNKCNAHNTRKKNKTSQYAKDNGDFIYNGLDRIDNNRSHELSNVVPCCKWCNAAKRDLTLEQFLNWIKIISKNLGLT